MMIFSKEKAPSGIRQEYHDLMRGIAGGMIFGMPVIYTMEVWFHSLQLSAGINILLIVSFLFLNILFSYFAGLREEHSAHRLVYALDDGVTSLGLAIILSATILLLIGRDLSQILLEAGIVSIGITFTNYKFKNKSNKLGQGLSNFFSDSKTLSLDKKQSRQDLSDLAAALVGSLVFSCNIAPTEEVTMIASGLNSLQLIMLIFAEILIAYILLYSSGLKEHVIYEAGSFFQHPINEVVLTVSSALVISTLLYFVIGYANVGFSSPDFWSSVIVLGLPATVGAAAGRLVI